MLIPTRLVDVRKRYAWLLRAGFPFLVPRRPTATERLRHFGVQANLARHPFALRLAARAVMTASWPFVALSQAIGAVRKDRATGRTDSGRSLSAYLTAALRHNASPRELRFLRTGADLSLGAAGDVLSERDIRIWSELNRLDGADPSDVQNKARFASICGSAGLPTVPVLAAFSGGWACTTIDRDRMDDDLFVKSLGGKRGEGAAIWRRRGAGYARDTETHSTLDDLLRSLATQDCIVQPLLRDAAAMRIGGGDGLSTVRLVTLRRADGGIEPLCAALHLVTSVLSQYGDVFGVAIADGRITSAFDAASRRVLRSDEAVARSGLEVVPRWSDMVALALDAHRRGFPRFVTLGWDIVLADGVGLCLLEANQGWGMLFHQAHDGPFGCTAIGREADRWIAAARRRIAARRLTRSV